jgi:hypothetical protein
MTDRQVPSSGRSDVCLRDTTLEGSDCNDRGSVKSVANQVISTGVTLGCNDVCERRIYQDNNNSPVCNDNSVVLNKWKEGYALQLRVGSALSGGTARTPQAPLLVCRPNCH